MVKQITYKKCFVMYHKLWMSQVFLALFTVLIDAEKLASKVSSIIFGGDIYLGGIVKYHVEKGDCSYNDSFKEIKNILKPADHTVVNLESIIVKKSLKTHSGVDKIMNMFAMKESLQSLKYAGISNVVLANNHLMDYGPKYVNTTVQALKEFNIQHAGVRYTDTIYGAQEPLILKSKGITVGILSYCYVHECNRTGNPGPAVYSFKTAMKDIQLLKKRNVNIIIIYFHWDNEYRILHSCSTRIAVVELSPHVHAIIGSHPHVTQSHYYYNNTLVVSSLGNFIFPMHLTMHSVIQEPNSKLDKNKVDDNWYTLSTRFMNPTAFGKLVRLNVSKSGLVGVDYLPIQIKPNKQRCLQASKEDNKTWQELCSASDKQCQGSTECNHISCHGVGMSALNKKCRDFPLRNSKPV